MTHRQLSQVENNTVGVKTTQEPGQVVDKNEIKILANHKPESTVIDRWAGGGSGVGNCQISLLYWVSGSFEIGTAVEH